MEYVVTRWPESVRSATHQATISVNVTAANHLNALELSGLKEPGALISVLGPVLLTFLFAIKQSLHGLALSHLFKII